jgi:tryptophan-rich sensory protein
MALTLFPLFLMALAGPAVTAVLFPPGPWYEALEKPRWSPPRALYAPAWALVYLLLAWAVSRIAALPDGGLAMGFFTIQLVLHTLWRPVFFCEARIHTALLIFALLWLATLGGTLLAYAEDGLAGLLMLPVLAWVGFILLMTLALVRLNPQV